jgi:hypothetical protein
MTPRHRKSDWWYRGSAAHKTPWPRLPDLQQLSQSPAPLCKLLSPSLRFLNKLRIGSWQTRYRRYVVGDFLAVLTLAKDLATALSETRGAPVELRRLKTRLDSLQTAIKNSVQTVKEWELAHPNPNKAPFNALVEEHKICKSMLEIFWKVSEKYTQSLLNGKGSKMKRECAKIK